MKVLVVGRSGQLATELERASWPAGVRPTALGRPGLDISDAHKIADAVASEEPDIIVNASAYNAVDRAKSESDVAIAVNAEGPLALAQQAKLRRIPLIHVSTDFVFNGSSKQRWTETDLTEPLNAYGRSKLLGEIAIRRTLEQHIILRTSWVFSAHGNNFVRTMLELAKTRRELSVVQDQIGCPTPAADLAQAIIEIVSAIRAGNGRFGTYHYSGAGAVSRYEFARTIFKLAGDLVPERPKVKPVMTAEYHSAARRPELSVLDTQKIMRDYAIASMPWTNGLKRVLADIRKTQALSR